MNIKNIHIAYFLGIGGIGMSGLARYFNINGIKVSGYDRTSTPLTMAMEAEGIKIHYNPDISAIPANADVIVYTPAIPEDFEECEYIKQLNIPIIKRSALLAQIINNLNSIAIAGTHGKTTTSAMIAHCFENIGMPFLGFVGGVLSKYNKNIFIHKNAEWAVAEADEYDRSFLALFPKISIVNAIDADHLDIYGRIEEMHNAFSEFMAQTSKDGTVLLFDEIDKTKLNITNNTVFYGFSNKKGYSARNIEINSGQFVFDIYLDNNLLIEGIHQSVAGRHNIQNAMAAFAAMHIAGHKSNEIAGALECFPGVKRRMELIAKNDKIIFYDDYAHHPAEIDALIDTMRELYPDKTITGLFQPHLYTRTKDFGEEFGKSLQKFDIPVITDIYPAREKPIPGIDATWLLSTIANNRKKYLPFDKIPDIVDLCEDGILITIGAGNIDRFVETIKKRVENK